MDRRRVTDKHWPSAELLKSFCDGLFFPLPTGGGGGTLAVMSEDAIGVKDAAAMLGVSQAMVRRMARRKNFRVLRRRPLLFSRRILEAFLRRQQAYRAAQDGLDRWVQTEPEYYI